MQRIAVFDLDQTITTRGTWGRFVSQSVKDKPLRLIGLWARAGVGQLLYKFTRRERISVKRGMLRWSLAGQSREELDALADAFAESEVKSGLRPGAVRQITQHRDAGDKIIIASAGADLVVEAIAKRIGIDVVVCTKLGWDGEKCSPNFASENCYAAGKLSMLLKRLETIDDFCRETVHITMYSDSYSDLSVLEYADLGVAVNADRKLLKAAPLYGFKTVDWSR